MIILNKKLTMLTETDILLDKYGHYSNDYSGDFGMAQEYIDDNIFDLPKDKCIKYLEKNVGPILEEIEDTYSKKLSIEHVENISIGIKQIVSIIYRLKEQPLTIYRGIHYSKINNEKIDLTHVGSSWTWSLDVAKKFTKIKKGENDSAILKTEVTFDNISPSDTYFNFLEFSWLTIYPPEYEIVVKTIDSSKVSIIDNI